MLKRSDGLSMVGASSEQLFLLAAERAGWPKDDPAAKKYLTDLFWEYMRMVGELTPVTSAAEREDGDVPHLRSLPEDWNDEDVDREDEDREVVELSDWSEPETEAAADEPDPELAKGAAAYFGTLQEVKQEAGRIRKELDEALAKAKTGDQENCRDLQKALDRVSAADTGWTPEEIETALSLLEEVAYNSMVGIKKGFLGMMNAAAQKIQELAKESWALAGQAQVDLDISAMAPEDPRSRIDRSQPLVRQMHRETRESAAQQHSGRLQRMIRFDDLQSDLKSQKRKRPPRN